MSGKPVPTPGGQRGPARTICGRAGLPGPQGQSRPARTSRAEPSRHSWRGGSLRARLRRGSRERHTSEEGRVGPKTGNHNAQHFFLEMGFETLSSLGMNLPGILTCKAARLRLNFSWAKSSPYGSLNAPCDRIFSPYGGNSCPD